MFFSLTASRIATFLLLTVFSLSSSVPAYAQTMRQRSPIGQKDTSSEEEAIIDGLLEERSQQLEKQDRRFIEDPEGLAEKIKQIRGVRSATVNPDGSITVNSTRGIIIIRDESTELRDREGNLLRRFENSEIGKTYLQYVDFLFKYVIPASISLYYLRKYWPIITGGSRTFAGPIGIVGGGLAAEEYLYRQRRRVAEEQMERYRQRERMIVPLRQKEEQMAIEAVREYNDCLEEGTPREECFKRWRARREENRKRIQRELERINQQLRDRR